MPAPLRILISGASVAGPALAWWLKRTGIACSITIVERAPYLRTAGQGLDIQDAAREVVKRMGIFDEIKARSSHEAGVTAVDGQNNVFARFAVDEESGQANSPTSDIEILRGELSKILYEVTKEDVKYVFGEMIKSLEETQQETKVHFANGTPTDSYDLVVAADGLGSKVRGMAFGPDATTVKSLNTYIAYYSIPRAKTDSMWARVHWLPRGRVMVLRPDNIGRMRPFLTVHGSGKSTDDRIARLQKASKEGEAAQKTLIAELFKDADWEVDRMVKGMFESDDFYLQHVAQVRMKHWSKERVTVLGDAGYAVSPYRGMGCSLAFLGAYVLAGEISRHPNDVPAALKSYESAFRPYVESVQAIPYGVPWAFLPQSKLGVQALSTFLWFASAVAKSPVATAFGKVLEYIPWGGSDDFKLPEYQAFEDQQAPIP